jgi:hypothetical protein
MAKKNKWKRMSDRNFKKQSDLWYMTRHPLYTDPDVPQEKKNYYEDNAFFQYVQFPNYFEHYCGYTISEKPANALGMFLFGNVYLWFMYTHMTGGLANTLFYLLGFYIFLFGISNGVHNIRRSVMFSSEWTGTYPYSTYTIPHSLGCSVPMFLCGVLALYLGCSVKWIYVVKQLFGLHLAALGAGSFFGCLCDMVVLTFGEYGVKWLYPFSAKEFKVKTQRQISNPQKEGVFIRRYIVPVCVVSVVIGAFLVYRIAQQVDIQSVVHTLHLDRSY